MTLAPALYANIESYGQAEELKPPSVHALIEELKDFDYSDHMGSVQKIKDRMAAAGYDTEGLEEVMGATAPVWDEEDQALEKKIIEDIRAANIDNSFMDPEEAAEALQSNLKTSPKIDNSYIDPREEDQPEALQARRAAWEASQAGKADLEKEGL